MSPLPPPDRHRKINLLIQITAKGLLVSRENLEASQWNPFSQAAKKEKNR
jgi:hypothetical protein